MISLASCKGGQFFMDKNQQIRQDDQYPEQQEREQEQPEIKPITRPQPEQYPAEERDLDEESHRRQQEE